MLGLKIFESSFRNCTSLTEIQVHADNTAYSVVNGLTADEVEAYVDVSGLTAGEYTLPVTLLCDGHSDLYLECDPPTVTVTIAAGN